MHASHKSLEDEGLQSDSTRIVGYSHPYITGVGEEERKDGESKLRRPAASRRTSQKVVKETLQWTQSQEIDLNGIAEGSQSQNGFPAPGAVKGEAGKAPTSGDHVLKQNGINSKDQIDTASTNAPQLETSLTQVSSAPLSLHVEPVRSKQSQSTSLNPTSSWRTQPE